MIAGSSLIFLKVIWNMLCLCAVLLKFWFQADLGPKSASYDRQGRDFDFCHHGHKLAKIYLQFFMLWWVHAENLCSILKLDNFDSWSWENFVSTCDVFNCLFPLDVQNEIQLPPIYWVFGWQMRRLSKWEIHFRVASFSFFTLLDA